MVTDAGVAPAKEQLLEAISQCTSVEISLGVLKKLATELQYDPAIILGHIPNGLHTLLHRHLRMPIVRRMDKENVVHITTEYYSAVKKSEVTKSASKWVELENTNLATSPRPVQKLCMFSLKCRSWLCFVCRSQETRKGPLSVLRGITQG